MYKVYCDSLLLYDDRVESLKIFQPKVDLELNKTGAFEFTIYNDHPYYGMIQKLKSIITVYQEGFLLFRGRVLNDEIGFHDEKQVFCEGELAFLLDSIQRPYDYSGTVSGFLNSLISAHNSQVDETHRFTLGNVTVTATDTFTRANVDYIKTWDVINKNLLEVLGGYLFVRHEGSVNYLDYLEDFTVQASQSVQFAKNLLDMKRIRKGEEIATALIPLGAKLTNEEGQETNERLTIKSVNNNVDYVYNSDAVASYGWIFATNTWDDVTDASELLTKGNAYLSGLISLDESVELDAADLAAIDSSIDSFHIGTYVNVTSSPHGIDENMLVSKLSINLLNPADNKLSLNGSVKGLTDNIKHDQEIIINNVQGFVEETVIQETTSIASSLIDQSAGEILQTVSETYYLKTDGDALGDQVSEISTTFTQNASAFEYLFTSAEADMNEVHQYIRFEEGNIILGESTNELTLKIENDRITFFDGEIEVAYFSNQKLYVTDGDFQNVLRIGAFGFAPRVNGNLSFSKL